MRLALRLSVLGSADELREGLAPDDDRLVLRNVNRFGDRNNKVLERAYVADTLHLRLEAREVGFCLHEYRRQVQLVIGTGREPASEHDALATYGHSAFAPMKGVAVLQVAAELARVSGLACFLRGLRSSRRLWGGEDREHIDAQSEAKPQHARV